MAKNINKTTHPGMVVLAIIPFVLLVACSSLTTKDSGLEPSKVEIVELSSVPQTGPEPIPVLTEQSVKPEVPAESEVEIPLPVPQEVVAEIVQAPDPVVVPEPVPIPETVPVPEPESPPAAPEPKPEPVPDPIPAPKPEPVPDPVAAPEPEPAPAPVAPTLDMETLETGLRKTKAIGLFTKLELKSQVEDLLDELEDYHSAKSTYSIGQLEEHFNLLVMKLMLLLQDDDPQLHRQIVQARPALWTTLADPTQFTSIKGP